MISKIIILLWVNQLLLCEAVQL